ncbi:uncharacterized protein Bfra_006771 [Botrytis fragariae]|uniref:Uncharacterized protein n=1 Tax=Botrytis fragariae TaxID=1964551 RepID=A0A8H6B5Y6_9HELO|nr:uncharacterized protein Bfra_006771 [Botrytis fragariae]KAF5879562.1 hypothetical protein Bfra_006771 [Botrytis fragariae]
MSNSYIRPPHYQRHHQSMLLNLCSIHPYFETDNFDREYQKELASVISQYPLTGLDFCYYWTEKVLWNRFQLSSAYGEFPGRYGGPEYIIQQQVGQLPPTPESAEPAPAISADFFDSILETLGTPSRSAKPAQPIRSQTPEISKATHETPVSGPVQQRVDLMAIPSQKLAQNHFEGYLKPPNTPASVPIQAPRDYPKDFVYPESPYTPVQNSQGFANVPLNPKGLGTSQTPNEIPVSTAGTESLTSTPSSILTARLALPGLSNPIETSNSTPAAPSLSLAPLPPLLLPDSVVKDPDTGELITIKMFERRCLGRGAEIAIRQAQAAVKATPNRMTKPIAQMNRPPNINNESSGDSSPSSFQSRMNGKSSLPFRPPPLEFEMQSKRKAENHTGQGASFIFQGDNKDTFSHERLFTESQSSQLFAQPEMYTNTSTPITPYQLAWPSQEIDMIGINDPQVQTTYSNLQTIMGNNPRLVMITGNDLRTMNNQQPGYLIIPIGQQDPSLKHDSTKSASMDFDRSEQTGAHFDVASYKTKKKELNAFNRLGPCANCKDPTHQLGVCMICNVEGYMDGCPVCNSLDHQFYECEKQGRARNTVWNYAVKMRNNKPPLRLLQDHRLIEKFGKITIKHKSFSPWTAEFAKNNRDLWKNPQVFDSRSRKKESKYRDPAWKHPNQVPLQISRKDMHLVKDLEGELRKLELYLKSLTENAEKISVRQSFYPDMAQSFSTGEVENHNRKASREEIRQIFKEIYQQPQSQRAGNSYQIGADQETRSQIQDNTKEQERSSLPAYSNESPSGGVLLQAPRVRTYNEMIAEEHAEIARRTNAWRQEKERIEQTSSAFISTKAQRPHVP